MSLFSEYQYASLNQIGLVVYQPRTAEQPSSEKKSKNPSIKVVNLAEQDLSVLKEWLSEHSPDWFVQPGGLVFRHPQLQQSQTFDLTQPQDKKLFWQQLSQYQ